MTKKRYTNIHTTNLNDFAYVDENGNVVLGVTLMSQSSSSTGPLDTIESESVSAGQPLDVIIGDTARHSSMVVTGSISSASNNDTFVFVVQKAAGGGYENDGGTFYFDNTGVTLDTSVVNTSIIMTATNGGAEPVVIGATITRVLL